MIITIDIGNSFIKIAVFLNGKILEVFTETEIDKAYQRLFAYPNAKIIWCSVKMSFEELTKIIDFNTDKRDNIIFSANTPIPIKNFYKTPNSLGVDRLAVAIGATTMFPQTNLLIIDAGTCITYDVVNSKQEYLGGSISPGFHLRYKSMHDYTARLPLGHEVSQISLTADNTKDAIQSGVVNGVIAEMKQIILQYQSQYPDLQTIICGGDADFLIKNLPTENITMEKNLVHLGLHVVMINLNALY